jgi:hypothetical protein
MKTHENSCWIEPAPDREIAEPPSSLEKAAAVKTSDPPNPSPAFAAPPTFKDTGGNHLTALDDW